MESYMCEIGLTLSELAWMEKHIRRLTREKRVPTPLAQFAARSFQSPTPYGTVPNHEPMELSGTPDTGTSDRRTGRRQYRHRQTKCLRTSYKLAVMEMIIRETYPPKYVCMITGGRQENQTLLTQRFDKIFFTGGKTVGREVLRHAAEYLTLGYPRTRRKKPVYRGFHRKDSISCQTYRLWKILKLRTDLCSPGLYPL